MEGLINVCFLVEKKFVGETRSRGRGREIFDVPVVAVSADGLTYWGNLHKSLQELSVGLTVRTVPAHIEQIRVFL